MNMSYCISELKQCGLFIPFASRNKNHYVLRRLVELSIKVLGKMKEEKIAAKAKAKAKAEASSKKEAETNWDYFNASWLFCSGPVEQEEVGSKCQQEAADTVSEKSVFSDINDGGSDVFSEPRLLPATDSEAEECPSSNAQASDALARDQNKDSSGGRAAKTEATDFNLVATALHPRPACAILGRVCVCAHPEATSVFESRVLQGL